MRKNFLSLLPCLLLSFGAALLLCMPLEAAESGRDLNAIHKAFNEPINLNKSTDNSMHVLFQHDQHKSIRCAECHHTTTSGAAYTSCSAEPGCHNITGTSTDPLSRFQAFHSKENERSCYACHFAQRARFDDVKGCTTCHKLGSHE